MTATPAAIMREAYVEEVAKYAHIPRKVMDMEQVMEAGFRAALRALAEMEPTETMRLASCAHIPPEWRAAAKTTLASRSYILAAAEEGEIK